MIDGYNFREALGAGGMGAVYKAEDIKNSRIVAVKLLTPNRDTTNIERFLREAEATSKLDHPGIIKIYDSGENNGTHYIVMPLAEGGSLEQKIRKREITRDRGIEIIRDVALALAHAHENNIIHRDIKPANILFDASGKPLVTDFGIAKDLNSDAQLTMTNQAVGTPSYMSPEQILTSKEVKAPSDVYSLGAVFYQLLTGVRPFEMNTELPNTKQQPDLLRRILTEAPVSPSELYRVIDSAISQLCLITLAKNPDGRLPMEELAENLAEYLSERSMPRLPGSGQTKLDERLMSYEKTLVNDRLSDDDLIAIEEFTGQISAQKPEAEVTPSTVTSKLAGRKWRSNVKNDSRVLPIITDGEEVGKVLDGLLSLGDKFRDIFFPVIWYEKMISLRNNKDLGVIYKKDSTEILVPDYTDIIRHLNQRAGFNIWRPQTGDYANDLIVMNHLRHQLGEPSIEYRPFLLLDRSEFEDVRFKALSVFNNLPDGIYNDDLNIVAIDLFKGTIYLGEELNVSSLLEMPVRSPGSLNYHPLPVSMKFALDFPVETLDEPECDEFERDENIMGHRMLRRNGDGELQKIGLVRDVCLLELLDIDSVKDKEIIYYPIWKFPVEAKRQFVTYHNEEKKSRYLRRKSQETKRDEAVVTTLGVMYHTAIWGHRIHSFVAESTSSGAVKIDDPSVKNHVELLNRMKKQMYGL